MFEWLQNQVQVNTDGMRLTENRQIPPGWQDGMTPADWVEYGRGYAQEEDIDEPDYQLPSSAVVNWGNGNGR